MSNDDFNPPLVGEDDIHTAPVAEGAAQIMDSVPVMTGLGGALVPRRVVSRGSVAIVPQTAQDVFRLSRLVFQSKLAPYGLDSEAKIAVAMLTGMELGLKPMATLSGIAVINGRPSIWGDIAMGLIRSTGLLEDFDETFEGTPYEDNYTAVCLIHRAGEKRPTVRRYSVAQAKRARLWDDAPMVRKTYYDKVKKQRVQSGSETPNDSAWFRFPDRMLQMRARGYAQRDAFQDVLKGMPLAEEMQDVTPDDEPGSEVPSADQPNAFFAPAAKTIEAPAAVIIEHRDNAAPSHGDDEGNRGGDEGHGEFDEHDPPIEQAMAPQAERDWQKDIDAFAMAVSAQKTVHGVRTLFAQSNPAGHPPGCPEWVQTRFVQIATAKEQEIDAASKVAVVSDDSATDWTAHVNNYRAALQRTGSLQEAEAVWESFDGDIPREVRERMLAMLETQTYKWSAAGMASAGPQSDAQAPSADAPSADERLVVATAYDAHTKAMRACKTVLDLRAYFEAHVRPDIDTYVADEREILLDVFDKRIKILEKKEMQP